MRPPTPIFRTLALAFRAVVSTIGVVVIITTAIVAATMIVAVIIAVVVTRPMITA